MKLLNFYNEEGISRLGIVENGRVFVPSCLRPKEQYWASVVAFIRGGQDAHRVAEAILDQSRNDLSCWRRLETLHHAPLVDKTCRIFCVGLNYADHAAENHLSPPKTPVFFCKLSSVVTPHEEPVPLPSVSTRVDYEAEFAFMMGRMACRVDKAEARQTIAGFTILNDVTARDMQAQDGQWFRGKNCDGFAPLGPWLVTADEIPDTSNLAIKLRLNGSVMQDSSTRQMYFDPAALVEFLSASLTLEPGDIISAGTPAGIGYLRKPQVLLHPGDSVEIEIERIGTLRNSVIE